MGSGGFPSPMRALVYMPLVAVWRPRLPTLLSVAQELIDSGHEVVLIGCDRSAPACTANLDHTRAACSYCSARRKAGLALLDGKFRKQTLDDYLAAERRAEIEAAVDPIRDVETLRSLHHETADVGYAALATYAYVARKPVPDFRDSRIARLIQQLVNAGRLSYEAMRAAIDRERPDRVVLHHGRGALDRAALRACQAAGVDCWVYETALSLDRLICFKNALPHDIDNFKHRVDEQWETGGIDREAVATAFYTMKRVGQRTAVASGRELQTQHRSFTDGQTQGLFPAGWDNAVKNVVIYGSSNDEFIAISPDYEERLHPSQIDALSRLSRDLENERVHFYFRVHPRQKGVEDDYIRELRALAAQRRNVTLIPADSKISSYALLDRADVVIAFLSTMSIEATFWGKPSIIISASIYRPMGASYVPADHDELLRLVRADLRPLDRLPALKFGYYQMTSGFEQPNYSGDVGGGRLGYTFRGNPILVKGPLRWRYWLSRERQRLKWRKLV
jgi:hypothetical protein